MKKIIKYLFILLTLTVGTKYRTLFAQEVNSNHYTKNYVEVLLLKQKQYYIDAEENKSYLDNLSSNQSTINYNVYLKSYFNVILSKENNMAIKENDAYFHDDSGIMTLGNKSYKCNYYTKKYVLLEKEDYVNYKDCVMDKKKYLPPPYINPKDYFEYESNNYYWIGRKKEKNEGEYLKYQFIFKGYMPDYIELDYTPSPE